VSVRARYRAVVPHKAEGETGMKWVVLSFLSIAVIVLVAVGAFFVGSTYGRQQALSTRTVTRQDGLTVNVAIDLQTSLGAIAKDAIAQLDRDERLRSNFTDDEATVVLGWADQWIEEQVVLAQDEPSAKQAAQDALKRVRPVVSAMNTLAARPGDLRLAESITALEPTLKIDQGLTRTQLFKLLTTLIGATWNVQSK
jgi:hypothetical protein